MVQTGLQDRVVLITGGNHGIGAATAKAFAAEGAQVLINYLRMPASVTGDKATLSLYDQKRALGAEEVLREIDELGGRAAALEADLADTATIPLLFDHAEKLFGPIDVLVNNADYCVPETFIPQSRLGITDQSPSGFVLSTITAESHDRHFAVNSRAVALLIAEFARRHIEQGRHWGRIISVSTDGAPGFVKELSYGASKYALESYTRAAAGELGKYGITANIVSPGPTQTGWISPELEARVIEDTPLGRVGQPADLADVIVFLASEQARWLTGQMLSVSGGRRLF